MKKKFNYSFEYDDDNDDRCPLARLEMYCRHNYYYCYNKGQKCKGKLEDRPEWCPLVEVNPSELTYKGYKARILSEFTALYGTVINIDDVITFKAVDFDQAQTEFETSVDYYLEFCEKHGRKPEQPWE